MNLLFKKALKDLLENKRRTITALISIFIGIISFGIMLFSYDIINREIVNEFNSINPASASITVDKVDQNLINLTNNFNGIVDFEEKAYYTFRIQTSEDESKTIELFSSKDFYSIKLNKITSISGKFQPEINEILIERDALKVVNTQIDESISISLDNKNWDFKVSGIVADISLHPASMHDTVYAYVSNDTLSNMGLINNKIDIVTVGDRYDREKILGISNEYITLLSENGYNVTNLEISDTPGVSMHLEEYKVSLILLQVFSIVTFIFGCMIMSNLISSILTNQIKQIGILKAIGTNSKKILFSYLLAFFILIITMFIISLLITIPFVGNISSYLMSLANMQPSNTSVDWYLYIVFGIFSLFVPMLIVFFSINKGLKITVKNALNYYGIQDESISNILPEFSLFSRPILLSIRNAVRKKKRFILNVFILSFGGAIFLATIVSMFSIQNTLSKNLDTLDFDYHIITKNMNDEELTEVISKISNVINYENWKYSIGNIVYENKGIGNMYTIVSPKDNSTMINPNIIDGRWISNNDTNEIVVTHKFFISESNYKLGDTIKLNVGTYTREFKIVGVIKDLGNTSIYMSNNVFETNIYDQTSYSNIKMKLQPTRRINTTEIDVALEEQNINILQSQTKSNIYDIFVGHFMVTLRTFLIVIIMLVIVTGFGLAVTMNIQTIERTKEIGIMKAIGASKKQIYKVVTVEGTFISLLSWIISIIIGIPLSILTTYYFGNIILNTPLDFNVSAIIYSCFIWFFSTLFISYFASKNSAKKAANMNIKCSLES